MTYIILAAGKGSNLYPLTLKYAKTSFRLDENTTVLQRMVRCIRKADKDAEIVVVVGYKADVIREELVEQVCLSLHGSQVRIHWTSLSWKGSWMRMYVLSQTPSTR